MSAHFFLMLHPKGTAGKVTILRISKNAKSMIMIAGTLFHLVIIQEASFAA
jgi:hypothetical protein